MVSFSSSVINKSRKKFAPKAPVRRAAVASTNPASKKPSVERQTSQTPQPPTSKAPSVVPSISHGPDPAVLTPPVAETQPAAPSQPTAQHETTTKEPAILTPERETELSTKTAVPISIPAPRRRTPTPIAPTKCGPSLPTPARSESSLEGTSPSETTSSQEQPVPANERPVPKPKSTSIQPTKRSHDATRTTKQATPAPGPDDSVQPNPAKRRKTSEITTPASNNDIAGPSQPPETRVTQLSPRDDRSAVAEGSSQAKPKVTAKKVRKPAKPRKKMTAEEAAALVVDGVVRGDKPHARARRPRAATPEDAESYEITPTAVKMSDLCRDLPRGRKSKREVELRNMDRTEAERKRNGLGKESQSSASKENTEDLLTKADEARDRAEAESQAGPQMRIVNGEIVLDSASLQIDRHANAARNAEDLEEVEENPLTRRINAASFGKKSKAESWDEEMTDLFYRGLRMFGTDFMMISKMFPGRTRRQIKLKFSNEERKYPEKIKDTLLGPGESITLETYSELTNTVYDDPKIILQELDDEKKRIEAEHAKEKEAQQELLHNPDGNAANADASGSVLPSIENGSNAVPRRQKKKNAQKKKFGGGTEEVLGSIDDGG